MSLRQALLYNVLSQIMCYVGCAVGIMAGSLDWLANVAFAIASGMFLYVAMCSLVPNSLNVAL